MPCAKPLISGAAEVAEDLRDAAWLDDIRTSYRSRYLGAALRAGELALASDHPEDAVDLAERALATDPWSERGGRLLASARLATGDRPGAIAALERCLAMLEELGAPPEPATNAIAARLQAR